MTTLKLRIKYILDFTKKLTKNDHIKMLEIVVENNEKDKIKENPIGCCIILNGNGKISEITIQKLYDFVYNKINS